MALYDTRGSPHVKCFAKCDCQEAWIKLFKAVKQYVIIAWKLFRLQQNCSFQQWCGSQKTFLTKTHLLKRFLNTSSESSVCFDNARHRGRRDFEPKTGHFSVVSYDTIYFVASSASISCMRTGALINYKKHTVI